MRDACHIAFHSSDDRAHASNGSVQMNTRPLSLVDQLVGYVGLPRLAFAFALAVVCLLVLLLFVAIFAQGGLPVGGRWGLWKMGLEPAVILYILAIYPPLHRRWTLAIDALRPLTNRPELVEQAHAVNRHGEWTALVLGAAFSVWVTHPWHFAARWATRETSDTSYGHTPCEPSTASSIRRVTAGARGQ